MSCFGSFTCIRLGRIDFGWHTQWPAVRTAFSVINAPLQRSHIQYVICGPVTLKDNLFVLTKTDQGSLKVMYGALAILETCTRSDADLNCEETQKELLQRNTVASWKSPFQKEVHRSLRWRHWKPICNPQIPSPPYANDVTKKRLRLPKLWSR